MPILRVPQRIFLRVTLCALLALSTVLGTALPGVAEPAQPGGVAITVLSSRPGFVSDGDALVRISLPRWGDPDELAVWLAGRDVGDAFTADPSGRSATGLVTGLEPGPNRLTAWLGPERSGFATAVLRNHPGGGPLLAGPHEQPFICQTGTFRTVTGDLLGPPTGGGCSVPVRVDYVYRSTSGAFRPLPSLDARPADLAHTTTSTGRRVPFLVRVETGVLNRSIYEVAVLHDPRTPAPDHRHPSPGWNRRLVYTFGGGCPGGWYVQGDETGGVLDPVMLGRGYAVASSSLNVFGNNCDDLLAAETMAMVSEHVIELLGEPLFTIGWGCSGGAYQVHQIGDNYPGLLDGIVAGCSFPEVGFGTVHTITDARLLHNYFTRLAPGRFTAEQRRAIAGFGDVDTIANLANAAKRIDPVTYCPGVLPAELRYHPVTNRGGARCSIYDHAVNSYGRDPRTGFARRPLDNVGIQYGLGALRSGAISFDDFIDLNTRVGGFDVDGNVVGSRTVADPVATRAAYRSGRLLNGGAGLASTPIIDYREYADELPYGDIHLRFHSFSTRARLVKANGDAANQVMLVESVDSPGFTTANPLLARVLTELDAWLTAITADDRHGGARERMLRNKPATLADACYTPGAQPREIREPQVHGVRTTRCNTLYPSWPAPREVAGADVANDVIKCRLRPVVPWDYPELTLIQFERLLRTFPSGVCDWSARGLHQQGLAGTWQKM